MPLSVLSVAVLVVSGCSDGPSTSTVVIATPWDRETCRQCSGRLAEAPGDPPPSLRWIRLDPWDDPAHLLDAGVSVDLLVGWPAATLDDLGRRGFLDPSEGSLFFLDRPQSPGSAVDAAAGLPIGQQTPDAGLVQGDPRINPALRDQVASLLRREGVGGVYAGLVATDPSPLDRPGESEAGRVGVAAVAGPSSRPEVRSLLDRLRRRSIAEPRDPGRDAPPAPEVRVLAAELIGATLRDAGPERREALAILARSADAGPGRALLAEPPPWPPDSIRRLGEDPDRRPMLDTLAAALVDDPGSRDWLLESWQGPPRPVDQALLEALATAGDGRLIRSSRVLPWLRAEWTAWARQRFTQIARELGPDADAEEAAR
ncbi:hypothetical protein AB1L88_18040 [Tautonia sp. JC769]|uniref:hypothetical protein n=1 Tax=Tautonia sp. JC769 TaxID=3232135 RepID=UPI003458FECC